MAFPMQWLVGGIAGVAGAVVAWRVRDYREPFAFTMIMLAAIGTVAVPHVWLELRYTYFAAPWFCMFLALVSLQVRHRRVAITAALLMIVCTITITWILEHKYDLSSTPARVSRSTGVLMH